MSVLKTYIRGLRELASTPPERLAVPNASPLAENMGRIVGQDTATQMNRGTQRMASDYERSADRQDIEEAKSDAGGALTVGVANLGLQGLSVRDQMIMAKHDEYRAQIEAERDDMLLKQMKKDREEYRNLAQSGGA